MQLKNYQMDGMLNALQPLLERRDVIGYAAARNARLLRESLTEYLNVRNELVGKYGDEGETGEVSIRPTSPRFSEFLDELGRYAEIAHDFEPFRIKYSEAIGNLTGQEMLAVDWMFED